jgi:spore germination cell wall hydrolase CwlJ-like protein
MMRWVPLFVSFFAASAATAQEQDYNIDPEAAHCLALNIYHEARGESLEGMIAVASVTLNRVASKRFPNTVCGVVFQGEHSEWWAREHGKRVPIKNRCQFSWYCDGRSDEIKNPDAWDMSVLISRSMLAGTLKGNTGGATHYYNPTKVNPWWSDSYIQTVMVDNHVFLR